MKLFLVEDEHWALKELVALCQVYEGEHTIYSFDNGDDALQHAKVTRPDLVITDITMPGMNGLQLIRELYKLDPSIKFVILTVHDQFSYAQEGLRLGVIDYLLKPIKKDALYETIDRAVMRIAGDEKIRSARNKWYLSQMLVSSNRHEGELYYEELVERLFLMIEVMIDEGHVKDLYRAATTDHQQLELLQLRSREYTVALDEHRLVMLWPLDSQANMGAYEYELRQWYEAIRQQRIVHIGYAVKPEHEALYPVFQALDERVRLYRTFAESSWLPPTFKPEEFDLSDVWTEIRVAEVSIKKGDIHKINELVPTIIAKLKTKQLTFNQMDVFLNDVAYSLRYKLLYDDAYHAEGEREPQLTEIRTYEQLSERLLQFMLNLCLKNETLEPIPKELVPKLINWIHRHFDEELSLQQFAKDHHISVGYLSRLFKEQTGQTFSDYVARYRIEKAKELIASGIARINDVCCMVGYEDSKYFGNLFKRIVGVSPREYQKKFVGSVSD